MIFRLVAATVVVFSLTSCDTLFGREGYFRDRGDDYVRANEIPLMKVPENMDSSAVSELFVIPPISNEYIDTEKEFEVPRPNFISSSVQAEIRIQKLDTRRWIAVNANASDIWPRVRHFLDENNIPATSNKTAVGEIETQWMTLADESTTRDRYKIRIEQGIHANSSEIHIIQSTASADAVAQGDVSWPASSVKPEREKWLLDKLAVYLTKDDKSGASLLAQSVGGARKVEFVQPYQADPFLVFMLDMDRTWASIGGALGKYPYAIIESDRNKGIYHLSYDPTPIDNEAPGFFCRLIACDTRAIKKRIKNLQYYQLQLVAYGPNEIRVFIQTSNAEALPYKDAEKLLSLIRNLLV